MGLIPPTVGRVVLYIRWNATAKEHFPEPLAAIVAKVHNLRCVNVGILDETGVMGQNATSITLVQPGDDIPDRSYVAWMDYQVGQAAQSDRLGEMLRGRVAQLEDEIRLMKLRLDRPETEPAAPDGKAEADERDAKSGA